jgi:hypothetical protein
VKPVGAAGVEEMVPTEKIEPEALGNGCVELSGFVTAKALLGVMFMLPSD